MLQICLLKFTLCALSNQNPDQQYNDEYLYQKYIAPLKPNLTTFNFKHPNKLRDENIEFSVKKNNVRADVAKHDDNHEERTYVRTSDPRNESLHTSIIFNLDDCMVNMYGDYVSKKNENCEIELENIYNSKFRTPENLSQNFFQEKYNTLKELCCDLKNQSLLKPMDMPLDSEVLHFNTTGNLEKKYLPSKKNEPELYSENSKNNEIFEKKLLLADKKIKDYDDSLFKKNQNITQGFVEDTIENSTCTTLYYISTISILLVFVMVACITILYTPEEILKLIKAIINFFKNFKSLIGTL